MTKTLPPIVFFGTEDFSLTALIGLIEAGYPIAAVVTKPDSKKGRGQQLSPPQVKIIATQHNIPVWQPSKLVDITDDIKKLNSPIGVLVSYGKIIPQSIIDLFSPGIINVHPSLLPKYRGPSPIESAIANGDSFTGVSIMQLSAQMDAGPVYSSKTHSLGGAETRPELYHALADSGVDLLLEVLPSIASGTLQPIPQIESDATYCQLLDKQSAFVDFSHVTAAQAERLVRAHLGFPKTKATIHNHTVVITKSHVTAQQKTPLDIQCQDGAFLSIDELVAPSGRTMTAAAFINGYL